MSSTLRRMDAFLKRSLEKRPESWVHSDSEFPERKHPWFDLYTDETTCRVGKIIDLSQQQDIQALRHLLACAAASAWREFQVIGGPAAYTERKKWTDDAIQASKRLRQVLAKGDRSYSTTVHKNSGDPKRSRTLVLSSSMRRQSFQLMQQLDEFIPLLEAVKPVKEDLKDTKLKTLHMQYLQFVVDRMTDVFVHFRSVEVVKRISYDSGTHGEYPDFVRAAAIPTLEAFYPGFAENPRRPDKLDVQIQDAVSRYRPNV